MGPVHCVRVSFVSQRFQFLIACVVSIVIRMILFKFLPVLGELGFVVLVIQLHISLVRVFIYDTIFPSLSFLLMLVVVFDGALLALTSWPAHSLVEVV